MTEISDPFWRQMDWVQPESYIADGMDCLLFATRNSQLYAVVQETLGGGTLPEDSGPQ